jgi:uncharacterized membrane protein YcgQ (UPF0703/DUF1980 family)
MLAAVLLATSCQAPGAGQATGDDGAASAVGRQSASSVDASTAAGGQPSDRSGEVVEIPEKLFLAQLNDICLNPDDYMGKTIKYQGMLTFYYWDETDKNYYLVYRQSPGCCGADGQAGFEVIWPEGVDKGYPNENDWCEVVGTLESYVEFGQTYLRIRLESLTVLQERGLEFVSQ